MAAGVNAGKSSFKAVLTSREEKLIRILREINYGEMIIALEGKQPVWVEEVRKSTKL